MTRRRREGSGARRIATRGLRLLVLAPRLLLRLALPLSALLLSALPLSALAPLAWPGPAAAQSGPSLNELALDWARGQYGSPINCQVGEEIVRALRRVILSPRRGPDGRPVLTVHFVDLRAEQASRCFNAVGTAQPNLLGKLHLRLEGRPHRDTAMRDFKVQLEREQGFDFEIVAGSLKIQAIALPQVPARTVDFAGGSAGLHAVAPASDAARELGEFTSPRKALLEIRSKDGESLTLPLFLASQR